MIIFATKSLQMRLSWQAASPSTTIVFLNILQNLKFSTVFTRSLQWSLSWASWIQCIQPHPIYLTPIFILSYILSPCLPSSLFPSGFPTETLRTFLFSPCMLHAVSLTWAFWLHFTNSTCYEASHCAVSSNFLLLQPSSVQIFSSPPWSQIYLVYEVYQKVAGLDQKGNASLTS
jgi:hypothetical protein